MEDIKKKLEILNKDFTTCEVTKASVDDVHKHPNLYRGSVKTSLGNILTTSEYSEWKKRMLSIKLP